MSISNKALAIIGGAAALVIVPAGVSFAVSEVVVNGHAAIHAPGFPGGNLPGDPGARIDDSRGPAKPRDGAGVHAECQ